MNASATKVVLVYKRDTEPDESLVTLIEHQLVEEGYSVFLDRHLTMGVDWVREIEA